MKRFALFAFPLLCLWLIGCKTPIDPAVADPLVACVGVQSGHGQFTGRGFFVSADGLVVTCEDAVHGGDPVIVTTNDGRAIEGKVVQKDHDNDLAIVKVPGAMFPVLHLHGADAEPGLHVRVLGNAGVRLGTFKEWESFGHEMGITADIGPGDAGAPVLADNGVVVGIVRADGGAKQVAVPAWRVIQMMPVLGPTGEGK